MDIVAVTAGHWSAQSGSVANSYQENIVTLQTTGYAISYLAMHGVYAVTTSGKLSHKVRHLNRFPLRCAVEIHYNATTSPDVNGAEVIYHPGSVKGLRLARSVYNEILSVHGITERRVIDTDQLGRNLLFTRKIKCPSIIVEPLWLTNPIESTILAANGNVREIGEAIGRGILRYLN